MPPKPSPIHSRRGAALILVLSTIVLLTALMIAFTTTSKNDLIATAQYAAGQDAAALSETATSLVMSQIREATVAGIDTQGRGTHAWASQPGALRVWDNQGNKASPYLYKLYSAARMKEDSMDFLPTEIPANWRSQPDAFTDLNEPVSRNSTSTSSGNATWRYPILNPAAIDQIDGFSSSQSNDDSVEWDTRTSMPVRWLYIGRNGTIQNSLQPDSIGRIAFWTDDETCKVNLNTASANADEPTIVSTGRGMPPNANSLMYSFWTIPRTRFMQDYNMGRSNPSQDEFQRYAAHPASVNLLSVLQGPSFAELTPVEKLNTLRNIFDLLPRYRWGGSENSRYVFSQTRPGNIAGANQKQERIYASVDELAFAQAFNSPLRVSNELPSDDLSNEQRIDMWRFFLTTASRAPDLNLFGQPRVALWPISGVDSPQRRTTQDNLIAFCSTVGAPPNGKQYFFQRLYPFSQTKDWDEFPRNQEIFAYLQRSTASEIPGFGGNFRSKYDLANGGVSGERDQILTAMFDYIRIANLNETFAGRPTDFQSYTPDTPAIPPGTPSNQYEAVLASLKDSGPNGRAGAGTVLPILTPFGRGAGRVPVLSEVGLFLLQRGLGNATEVTNSDTLQTSFLIETFTPTLGYMPWTPRDFRAQLSSTVQVNGQDIFPNSAAGKESTPVNRTTVTTSRQPVGGTGGVWDIGFPLNNTSANMLASMQLAFGRNFSNSIASTNATVNLAGGSIDLSFIMSDADGSPVQYQNYQLFFPGVAALPKPSPRLPLANTNPGSDWMLRNIANTHLFAFPEDVVRSLVPRDGDYRIVAYLQNVPEQFFRPHPDFNSMKNAAHSIRFRRNFGWAGASGNLTDGTTNGTLVGLPYFNNFVTNTINNTITNSPVDRIYKETHAPDIPSDIMDLVATGWEGDWNNGIGNFPDGAYLDKPDEGVNRLGGFPNYFQEHGWSQAEGFYSPTQTMPSAVVFGSIPTAVRRTFIAYSSNNFAQGRPWRTLLFCPNPDISMSSDRQHYGSENPPDYLLADLFNQPVIEPYAISEPISTAGRINLNYQILPFTNIERSTGIRAALSGQRVSAIPNTASAIVNLDISEDNTTHIHHEIDPAQTLLQFTQRFNAGDIFRSAAEICSIFLIPKNQTLSDIRDFWSAHRMTGDNMRENPYKTLYPLLTTKSNTYTVHIRAQSLAEGKNIVTGEYRGSTMIERYIDPADDRIGTGNGKTNPDTQSLEPLYRFRVVETKRFAP